MEDFIHTWQRIIALGGTVPRKEQKSIIIIPLVVWVHFLKPLWRISEEEGHRFETPSRGSEWYYRWGANTCEAVEFIFSSFICEKAPWITAVVTRWCCKGRFDPCVARPGAGWRNEEVDRGFTRITIIIITPLPVTDGSHKSGTIEKRLLYMLRRRVMLCTLLD